MDDIRYLGKLNYKIGNVGFVSVLRKKDFIFEFKKGKKQFSFIFVESGRLEYSFKDGNKLLISKGDTLFIPKKLPYKTTYLEDNTKIKIITFDCTFYEEVEDFKTPFVKNDDRFSSAFLKCTEEKSRNALFLFSKLYEILYIMQTLTLPEEKKYRKILPAVEELRTKFYENQKISYYASLCNMSESNFRKLFKEYTSLSPLDFRNHIRMDEVKKMTASGEYSVSEAAFKAGFNNMSFFYELYRKVNEA